MLVAEIKVMGIPNLTGITMTIARGIETEPKLCSRKV
jgi:hypothetical protein